MIDKLLTPQIADIIKNKSSVSELRIRAGRNVVYYTTEGRGTVCKYIATRKDIEDILLNASGGSLYTVNDMLNKGFIMYEGGVRIGLTGEGVTEKGELIGIKNVCYLTVRIPREIELNTEKLLLPAIPQNMLILSPPGAGKTTLLRALTRHYSDSGYNVLLIDERYELAAVKNGQANLNVGINTDIVSGVPKALAYEIAVRTMRPEIISTDELYEESEAFALSEAAHCGVKVFMTAHASNLRDFKLRRNMRSVLDVAERVIILDSSPEPGTIIKSEAI